MRAGTSRQDFITLLLVVGFFIVSSCGKPGDITNNFTNSVVTVSSINGNQPLQSDVIEDGHGADDIVAVNFQCESRVSEDDPTDPDGPSPFDTIQFRSYHVAFYRSDGGPNPTSFTAGLNVTLAPNSEVETNIILVRGFDKHRFPLETLRDDGEIFTTCIVTFYGEDRYGNDVAVSASLAVAFANFPDA